MVQYGSMAHPNVLISGLLKSAGISGFSMASRN